ncbi:MAG TPA: hypothetical protein VMF06_05085 [Candidatus Limnocylindria bacterium]|jgi:hypothetical protein|nr:hypothetical protein [Candidatus Limnocylindria bacterium]
MPQFKTDPCRVEIEGKHVKCLICGHEQFHRRRVQVDTALSTGMSQEWHHNAGYCLLCDHCGFIHWFVQK